MTSVKQLQVLHDDKWKFLTVICLSFSAFIVYNQILLTSDYIGY